MEYNVIKSRRRTMSIEVSERGVTVRAPLRQSDREISEFVASHAAWIRKNLERVREQMASAGERRLTGEDVARLTEDARRVIPERVALFAPDVGVKYGRISIKHQRTKWGSASSKGNLNFNCLLMLTPPEVLDSVVVHELCHLKHMDHSAAFYAEVRRVCPEYDKWNGWLKKNGKEILLRLPR